MDMIASVLAKTFKNWNIELPPDAMTTRQAGTIKQAGWIIRYVFGPDYLDYYASHRMTNDRHVRIHSDGRTEGLEAPQDMYVVPGNADEATRSKAKADFQECNRAVHQKLKEKGIATQGLVPNKV